MKPIIGIISRNYKTETNKKINITYTDLISSIINGKLNKKRGLINGVIMTSLYLITILIFKMFNQDITLSSIIIKSIVIIIGNIIGVNI